MVYTGNGKGKTTAALGLALRTSGHGKKVFMVQFRKSDPTYGEIQAIRKYLPNITVVQSKRSTFRGKGGFDPLADVADAKAVLAKGRQALRSGDYELVIFDEINYALHNELLNLTDVLTMCQERPQHVNLVLTGRYARQEIIAAADLVSEVSLRKHHYQAGIKAQPGIEF